MANPERRQELERQRAIIQEHLAWLDREIARTEAAASSKGTPSSPPPQSSDLTPENQSPPSPAETPPQQKEETLPLVTAGQDELADAFAEELLPEGIDTERRTAAEIQKEIRGGCFFYCALLVLASLLFYGILHFVFVTSAPDEEEDHPPSEPSSFPIESTD
ncbi:MAG: hypothetical protein LAT55_01400 [Opitutales bacterium]|nr:hypothetical protein [Opitutales bacterium]